MASVAWSDEASWADAFFSESGHDFGPVPRGAKVRHSFVLTNRLSESVSILDVRASCGCTTGRPSANTVAAGQRATIEAEMDTRNFVGPKATTLTITLVSSSGRQADVKFGVRSNILSDIVLNPGTIDFGTVSRGQAPKQTLTIERVGTTAWRVIRVAASPALFSQVNAALVETARSADGVTYTLAVGLKPDAAAGVLRDEIRVITNDAESPVIPIQVTATILGNLTARPAVLDLGHVASAAGVSGRYLVSASAPFSIMAIEGTGDGFNLTAADRSRKVLHVLTLTYSPEGGTGRGDLQRRFHVKTDLPDEPPIELKATLHVEP
jgi:hypothetical protein